MRAAGSFLRRVSRPFVRGWATIHRDPATVWKAAYCGAVVYLVVRAIGSRFGLPLEPLVDLDVAGYLSPALSKLNGGPFIHVSGLNFLYPGALLFILGAARDFRAIVIVQHFLGLLGGALFLLAWNRLADLCSTPRLHRAAHQAIGLFGVAIFLLSNRSVFLELRVRSDAVCLFFQMATLWLTLEFFHSRLVLDKARRSVAFGCAAVGCAWLLASLKPSFLLFALLTIAIVGWLTFGLREARLKLVFAATATAMILAIQLPEQFLRRSDPTNRRFLTETLFAVHAKLIRTQIENDLQSGETEGYSPVWLKQADQELGEEMVRTRAQFPSAFRSLGFQPDYLMNGSDALFSRWARELGGEEPLLKFLRYYYWRALLHEPFAFARKVGLQMSTFYGPYCRAFSLRRQLPLAPKFYLESGAALEQTSTHGLVAKQEFGRAYLSRINALSKSEIRITESQRIWRFNALLAQGYRFVCLLGVIVAIWLFVRRRPRRPRDISAPLIAVFLCLPNLANTFSISLVHTMDVDRYSQVQFGAALLAELWILRCLLALSLTRMNRFTSWISARSAPPFPSAPSENNLATQ